MYVRNTFSGHGEHTDTLQYRDYARQTRENRGLLIPNEYHGELLRKPEPDSTEPDNDHSGIRDAMPAYAENGSGTEFPERHGENAKRMPVSLLAGGEDTLLLCAVGVLLYTGLHEKRSWSEEDLALLLILFLMIA